MAAETAFRSDERFDQRAFRRWLNERPSSDLNHYELIDGRIVMTPPAGWPHGGIGANIVAALKRHIREGGAGTVLDSSTGYELPSGDTVEPDVSFISAGRFAKGPRPTPGQFLRIVPTLVVEILSPSTARRDRTEKKRVYESNGVDEYWIVDPSRKTIAVFHLVRRAYTGGRAVATGLIRSRVLPRLQLTVEDVFAL